MSQISLREDITNKISFDNVLEYIQKGEYEKLGRSKQQEMEYKESIALQAKEWFSAYDYILHKKFKVQYEVDNNGKKNINKNLLNLLLGNIVTSLNDHPYYYEDNILHYVTWKLNTEITKDEIKKEIELLKIKHNVENATYFLNPPSLQSIPEVFHIHIIIKLKSNKKYINNINNNMKILLPIFNKYIKKTIKYGCGFFIGCIVLKVIHTATVYKYLIKDINKLGNNKKLSNIILFYIKYAIPFPFSYFCNKIMFILVGKGAF